MKHVRFRLIFACLVAASASGAASAAADPARAAISTTAASAPRARDLGVPFEGEPGPLNAITDVTGLTVGQVTLIEDLADGRKVRTGVTAILPRGADSLDTSVYGGWFALNGNGEMTGTAWIDESGSVEGPIMITNTHSVGVVRDAVIAWRVRPRPPTPRATGGRCPSWRKPGTGT